MPSILSPSRAAVVRRVPGLWLMLALAVVPAAHAVQGLTPEQVVELQQVGTVALSPDGRLVAHTLNVPRAEQDEPGPVYGELWIVDLEGGDPRPVIRRPGSASSPAWSPDGNALAFIARIEEQHERPQVYSVDAAGADPQPLTRSPTGVRAFAWSPDGRSIAYTAQEPEPEGTAERRARGDDVIVLGPDDDRDTQLWLQPVDGGEPRPLTPDTHTIWDFVWAPDGRRLAIQMSEGAEIDTSYMFTQIYTLSVDGGGPERLVETEGKLGPMAWSPNGRRLAYLGATSLNDPLAQSVFVVSAAGGDATNVTPGYEGSAISVGWQNDDVVLFVADEGTRTALNRVAAAGSNIERVAGGGSEVFGFISLDARRRTFATAAHTAGHPSEVYAGTLRRRELRRVTDHNPWLAEVQLAPQETIEWTAEDGRSIEGVLLRPLDESPARRYPLAILPHGGPEGVSQDGWTTRPLYPAQVLAARGYAVLMPNYRGSAGRGVEFSKGDHRDLGGMEFDDVLAGIDHLEREGLIDPDRVGISGTSYGGYFSAWGATRHTDRFRAAVVFAGLTNWISFTGTTDIPYEMSIVHWDQWWFENQGEYWDRSPLRWIERAETPTLVVHGLADDRVHPEQSLELYNALRIQGVPTQLILYPREPHGLRERAHQLDFMNRLIEWLDRYLKGPAAATE